MDTSINKKWIAPSGNGTAIRRVCSLGIVWTELNRRLRRICEPLGGGGGNGGGEKIAKGEAS